MNLARIFSVTIKEILQMSRDKKLYPLLFLAPTIQIVILGYAATFDIQNIPTAVLDRDHTQLSRQYLRSFYHNGYFDIKYCVSDRNQIYYLLDKGKVKIGIEIPTDFEKMLKKGGPTPVQFILDGTESNSATIALNYARIISEKFSSRLIMEKIDLPAFNAGDFLSSFRGDIGKTFLVDNRTRLWYNPDLSSPDFMVPGVICMILLIVTTNLTAISIVKEKEIGTMEQLRVTPIKPSELIIGKLIPFCLIGFIDVILILLVGYLVFHIPVKGSLVLLLILSFFYLLSTLGLGIFISTLVQSQDQSMIITFSIVLTMNVLSGVIFPIANMPQVIQYFTYLMPIRYFAIIVRGILLRGIGIEFLWPQVTALIILGFLSLALSINRLRGSM
ncbi:MAG: ABC transporter permease [Deltaproteobacteria bacterium]|nr:ABC transporter permease [Deltaproteobacteria bacterium]